MYGYNEHTLYNIIKMEQEVKKLFKKYETLQPSFTVDFTVYHHKIELSQYMEVTVYVSDVDEVPHSFIMGVEAAVQSTLGVGHITINVEPIIDDEGQYDFWDSEDVWDSNLAIWEQEVGGEPSRLTYHYQSTPEEDHRAKKLEWPFYGTITVNVDRSHMGFERNGNNGNLEELGYYKGLTESLNKLLRHFGSQEIDYKVIKQVDKGRLLDNLARDIQYLKESITKQERGYISELYSKDTYELHRELVLYYDLGLKQAYFSYNTLGYNYQWNTANSESYNDLNYAAKYHLNDLSWKGFSSPGWQKEDSAGRCERVLHVEPSTFTTLQLLFEEELGSLFSLQEWRINRGQGIGVIFTLDVLVEGDITEVKETYKHVLYLNAKGEIVASISGYKQLHVGEGKDRINELRTKIGIQ